MTCILGYNDVHTCTYIYIYIYEFLFLFESLCTLLFVFLFMADLYGSVITCNVLYRRA